MAKILYENKEDVYVDSSIPDKNKVKAVDMNNIKEVVNTNENKILLAISDTAPSTCATGDLYYNTTSKKIFEATGTNTWGEDGTNPTSNTIYILFDTKTTYSYDGTDLVSVGGGGAEISVSITEPTGEDADSVKLWINPNEAPSGSLNPISNTYGVAQDKGYSQEYANEHFGGVVLYDNSNGTNQNITLNNDTFENYSKIEILTKHWYFDEWQTYVLVEPNNKNHNLDMNYIRNDGIMYITSTTININNATLSYTFSGAVNTSVSLPVGGGAIQNDTNVRQKIYKIIGYK